MASTEQASSADNISSEEMASNMSRPRTHATDLSAINNSTHHINTGTVIKLSSFFARIYRYICIIGPCTIVVYIYETGNLKEHLH